MWAQEKVGGRWLEAVSIMGRITACLYAYRNDLQERKTLMKQERGEDCWGCSLEFVREGEIRGRVKQLAINPDKQEGRESIRVRCKSVGR